MNKLCVYYLLINKYNSFTTVLNEMLFWWQFWQRNSFSALKYKDPWIRLDHYYLNNYEIILIYMSKDLSNKMSKVPWKISVFFAYIRTGFLGEISSHEISSAGLSVFLKASHCFQVIRTVLRKMYLGKVSPGKKY